MHLLFLLLPVKCTSNFQKRRPHRWHGVGTDMWHKKRRPSLPLDHLSQGLELWKKWTYCSLANARKQYIRWPLVFERLIPHASILADFCAANNLHRILLSLLPIRLSTHGVSLFTIVRLIAAFALLTPSHCLYLSQNDHRTRERRHGNRGNSTIWQSKSAI